VGSEIASLVAAQGTLSRRPACCGALLSGSRLERAARVGVFAFQTSRRIAEAPQFALHKLIGSIIVLITPTGVCGRRGLWTWPVAATGSRTPPAGGACSLWHYLAALGVHRVQFAS